MFGDKNTQYIIGCLLLSMTRRLAYLRASVSQPGSTWSRLLRVWSDVAGTQWLLYWPRSYPSSTTDPNPTCLNTHRQRSQWNQPIRYYRETVIKSISHILPINTIDISLYSQYIAYSQFIHKIHPVKNTVHISCKYSRPIYCRYNDSWTADMSTYTSTNGSWTVDMSTYTSTNGSCPAEMSTYTSTNDSWTADMSTYTSTNDSWTADMSTYTSTNGSCPAEMSTYTSTNDSLPADIFT